MEDVYHRYKALLEGGRLLKVVADEEFAWWIISDRGRLLIPLMALDSEETERSPEYGAYRLQQYHGAEQDPLGCGLRFQLLQGKPLPVGGQLPCGQLI